MTILYYIMLFVMMKACLHLKNILLFRNWKELILLIYKWI